MSAPTGWQPFAEEWPNATRGPQAVAVEVRDDIDYQVDPAHSARKLPIQVVNRSDLAMYVRFQVKRHDDAMKGEYARWQDNRLLRHSTHEADDDPRHVEPTTKAPDHRTNYRIPAATSLIEQHINLRTGVKFRVEFEPATGDLDDAMKAEAASIVMRYQDAIDDPEVYRAEALEYAVDCGGLGWGLVYHDTQGGAFLGHTWDGQREVPVYEGIARPEVVPTWQMGWDPNAIYAGKGGLDKCQWVFRRQRMTRVDLARFLSSEELAKVDAQQGAREGERSDSAFWDLDDPSGDIGQSAYRDARLTSRPFEVISYFERRCADYPFGLYALNVNDCCIRGGTAPFAHLDRKGKLDLPFRVYCHIPVAGKLLGVSLTSRVSDLQEIIETSENSRLERDRACAYLTFLTTGFGNIEDVWETEHGIVLDGPPGSTIQAMDIKPAGADEYASGDRARLEMGNAVAIHDITQGSLSDETLGQSEIRRDADQLGADRQIRRLNGWHQELVQMQLLLIAKLYAFPRLLRIAGDFNTVQTRWFQGTDIDGFEDVRVYSDTALPPGQFGRLGTAVKMAQAWALTVGPNVPMLTPDKFHDLVGFDDTRVGEQSPVFALALNWALDALATGVPAPFSMHHDHPTFYRVYRKVLHSKLYLDALPQGRAALDFMLDRTKLAMDAAAGLLMPPPGGAGAPGDPASNQPPAPLGMDASAATPQAA